MDLGLGTCNLRCIILPAASEQPADLPTPLTTGEERLTADDCLTTGGKLLNVMTHDPKMVCGNSRAGTLGGFGLAWTGSPYSPAPFVGAANAGNS